MGSAADSPAHYWLGFCCDHERKPTCGSAGCALRVALENSGGKALKRENGVCLGICSLTSPGSLFRPSNTAEHGETNCTGYQPSWVQERDRACWHSCPSYPARPVVSPRTAQVRDENAEPRRVQQSQIGLAGAPAVPTTLTRSLVVGSILVMYSDTGYVLPESRRGAILTCQIPFSPIDLPFSRPCV